jgi:Ala-tRNA(Pro) deacylase
VIAISIVRSVNRGRNFIPHILSNRRLSVAARFQEADGRGLCTGFAQKQADPFAAAHRVSYRFTASLSVLNAAIVQIGTRAVTEFLVNFQPAEVCPGKSIMTASVLATIRQLLVEQGVAFQEKQHPPTATSIESAAARGEPLGVGAKALLLKTDDAFCLFVLCADRKLDSAAIKRQLKVKNVRFATAEELTELTGLVPGAVPPFGLPILSFELFADTEVGVRHDRVAFNAGSLTDSIILAAADWERIARPIRLAFAKQEPAA